VVALFNDVVEQAILDPCKRLMLKRIAVDLIEILEQGIGRRDEPRALPGIESRDPATGTVIEDQDQLEAKRLEADGQRLV
jgi:hypothetical protein